MTQLQIAVIPDRPTGRVPRHVLSGFFGCLFFGVGYVALAGLVFASIIFVLELFTRNSRTNINVADFLVWCVATALIGAIFVPIGLWILRGRRRLVLFLRRFGLSTSTAAMTRAISDGLGSRWRVVTLDDHSVAPVGVDQTPRRRLRWARYAAVLVTLPLAWALWSIWNSLVNNPGHPSTWQDLLGALIVLLIGGVLVLTAALILGAFFVSAMIGLVAASWFARGADRSKTRAITSVEQINPTAKRLAASARHVFAPRLVVLRVDNALWQQVVDKLIQLCDAVVVDISSLSPNLAWEIATLNSGGKPWIALGQLDRLTTLQRDGSQSGLELQRLIGNRVVLAYRDDHPLALAQSLGTALNSTVA